MERHIRIYNRHFDIGAQDFRQCEITGRRGRELHHIFGRVMNEHLSSRGITDVDDVRNVMALCREAHEFYGQKEQFNDWLWDIHQEYLNEPVALFEKNFRDPNLLKFFLVFRNKFTNLGRNRENFTFEEE